MRNVLKLGIWMDLTCAGDFIFIHVIEIETLHTALPVIFFFFFGY